MGLFSFNIEVMPKRSGFTLVELLVVIAIIGILTVIGAILYTSVMKEGRDSKRKSDLMSIQSALEQYYNDQGFYPFAADQLGRDGLDGELAKIPQAPFKNIVGTAQDPSVSKTYINLLPQDPTGTLRYRYESFPSGCDNIVRSTSCNSYCLYSDLENSSTSVKPAACSNPLYSSYKFALTPP